MACYAAAMPDEERPVTPRTRTADVVAAMGLAVVPELDERDPIMRQFAWSHLPASIATAVRPIAVAAHVIHAEIPPGEWRAAALRHLLDAKDDAIRAATSPG